MVCIYRRNSEAEEGVERDRERERGKRNERSLAASPERKEVGRSLREFWVAKATAYPAKNYSIPEILCIPSLSLSLALLSSLHIPTFQRLLLVYV